MKTFDGKSVRHIALSLIVFLAWVPFFAKSPSINEKKLSEIYRNGVIELKPQLEISLDTLPEDVMGKMLFSIIAFKDRLFVTDIRTHDLKILNNDGTFVRTLGQKGKGPSDLLSPTFMCISKNRLLVWETMNRRVSYSSGGGKFLKIEKVSDKGRFKWIRALTDGRIILETTEVEANKAKREIFEWRYLKLYSSEMKFIKTICRQKEYRFKYSKKPPFRRIILPYTAQLYWDVLPGNKVVTGFSDQYQLKIIDVDTGETRVISRDYQRVKVTEDDKKLVLANRFSGSDVKPKLGADKYTRDNIEFPEFKPVFKTIKTDSEGNILVFIVTKHDQSKLTAQTTCFDAFDSNGNFINHVKTKSNVEISAKNLYQPKGSTVIWLPEFVDVLETKWIKYSIN